MGAFCGKMINAYFKVLNTALLFWCVTRITLYNYNMNICNQITINHKHLYMAPIFWILRFLLCCQMFMKDFTTNKRNDFIKSHGTSYLINCGSLENLHRNASFLPNFTDGFCLQYKKILAPNASLNVKYVLSQVLPSGLRIGCVLRPKMIGHVIDSPQLEADISPTSLTTNLCFQYHPISPIRLRISAQLFPKAVIENDGIKRQWSDKVTLSADYYSRNATTTISLHNWKRDSGRLTLTQLRSYSSRVAFGFELLAEWKNKRFSALIPSIGGRYFLEDMGFAATLAPRGLDFTFWHLINNDNQFGCSFLYNHMNCCCLGNIYYQLLYNDECFRGCINSNGAIGVTYSRRISEFGGCNAELSLLKCIPTKKFSLGVKFEFDSFC